MNSLESLPHDIVWQIFRNLGQEEWWGLRFVSKALNETVTPICFRRMKVDVCPDIKYGKTPRFGDAGGEDDDDEEEEGWEDEDQQGSDLDSGDDSMSSGSAPSHDFTRLLTTLTQILSHPVLAHSVQEIRFYTLPAHDPGNHKAAYSDLTTPISTLPLLLWSLKLAQFPAATRRLCKLIGAFSCLRRVRWDTTMMIPPEVVKTLATAQMVKEVHFDRASVREGIPLHLQKEEDLLEHVHSLDELMGAGKLKTISGFSTRYIRDLAGKVERWGVAWEDGEFSRIGLTAGPAFIPRLGLSRRVRHEGRAFEGFLSQETVGNAWKGGTETHSPLLECVMREAGEVLECVNIFPLPVVDVMIGPAQPGFHNIPWNEGDIPPDAVSKIIFTHKASIPRKLVIQNGLYYRSTLLSDRLRLENIRELHILDAFWLTPKEHDRVADYIKQQPQVLHCNLNHDDPSAEDYTPQNDCPYPHPPHAITLSTSPTSITTLPTFPSLTSLTLTGASTHDTANSAFQFAHHLTHHGQSPLRTLQLLNFNINPFNNPFTTITSDGLSHPYHLLNLRGDTLEVLRLAFIAHTLQQEWFPPLEQLGMRIGQPYFELRPRQHSLVEYSMWGRTEVEVIARRFQNLRELHFPAGMEVLDEPRGIAGLDLSGSFGQALATLPPTLGFLALSFHRIDRPEDYFCGGGPEGTPFLAHDDREIAVEMAKRTARALARCLVPRREPHYVSLQFGDRRYLAADDLSNPPTNPANPPIDKPPITIIDPTRFPHDLHPITDAGARFLWRIDPRQSYWGQVGLTLIAQELPHEMAPEGVWSQLHGRRVTLWRRMSWTGFALCPLSQGWRGEWE